MGDLEKGIAATGATASAVGSAASAVGSIAGAVGSSAAAGSAAAGAAGAVGSAASAVSAAAGAVTAGAAWAGAVLASVKMVIGTIIFIILLPFIAVGIGIFYSMLTSSVGVTYILALLNNIWMIILNFIQQLLWIVVKFLLGILEAFEYMITTFLGIKKTTNNMTEVMGLDEFIGVAESVEMGNGYNYLDVIVKTFKALCGVSLILIIIFTIIAIVKQEWSTAANEGFMAAKESRGPNNKNQIIMRAFKGIIGMIAIPVTMVMIFMGVNSILAAFNNALNVSQSTVAGQVLTTSTYDANKYRQYANSNQRIPISITAYDTNVKPDEISNMKIEIMSEDVQSKLRYTGTHLVNNTFPSFGETLVYKNNKLYNGSAYRSYYENFLCTAEQYQVMADFIDYTQNTGMNFYIKSIDDENIEWKHVDKTIYDDDENTLTITYRDASDLDKDGDTKDSYTLVYSPKNEVTTPIQDALNSIMAMLGVGDYSDNVYNVMERDDSGEFLNLVQWANEKCLVYLSDTFDIANQNKWTDTDEIIMFEYYHFDYNNTFANYSLNDFRIEKNANGTVTGGVELDVYKIVYRNYNATIDAYTDEKEIKCVYINGTYYYVEESDDMVNEYGNPYYELRSLNDHSIVDKNVHFLDPSYSVVTKTADTVQLKLESDFNINDPVDRDGNGKITNVKWKLFDQILVYEYYKDLSVGNDLSKFNFADFYSQSSTDTSVPVYEIQDIKYTLSSGGVVQPSPTTTTNYYVLINGTYYQLNSNKTLVKTTTDYLAGAEYANSTFYNYTVELLKDGTTGFNDSTLVDANSFLYNYDSDSQTVESLSGLTFEPLGEIKQCVVCKAKYDNSVNECANHCVITTMEKICDVCGYVYEAGDDYCTREDCSRTVKKKCTVCDTIYAASATKCTNTTCVGTLRKKCSTCGKTYKSTAVNCTEHGGTLDSKICVFCSSPYSRTAAFCTNASCPGKSLTRFCTECDELHSYDPADPSSLPYCDEGCQKELSHKCQVCGEIFDASVTECSNIDCSGTLVKLNEFEPYESFSFNLSENFDYSEPLTWSYKDYFLFYLFAKYNVSISLDSLKYVGLQGNFGKLKRTDGTYEMNGSTEAVFFETEQMFNGTPVYIIVDTAKFISELNISTKLEVEQTLNNNDYDTYEHDLFISYNPVESDKITLTELNSTRLYFSSNFIKDNPSTWTVLDYLLLYFAESGVISNYEDIVANGYGALVYDTDCTYNATVTGSGGSPELVTRRIKDKFYKFGKTYENVSSNTYYLSEYNVLNNIQKVEAGVASSEIKFTSIDKWFNMNFYDFICAKNSVNPGEVVTTYADLSENLLSMYQAYIYDIGSLANEMVSESGYTSINSSAIPTYRYNNSSYNKTNLATWNLYDLLRYCYSKTATGSYGATVIQDKDGKLYASIGSGKYVDISEGSIFKSDLANNSTLTSHASSITTGTKLSDYIRENEGNITHRGDIVGLKQKTLAKYTYRVVSTASLNKNSTYNSVLPVTEFDIILALYYNNGIGIDPGAGYMFDLYEDESGKVYVKVSDDIYVQATLKTNEENLFSVLEYNTDMSLTITGSAKDRVFSVNPSPNSTYRAFYNLNQEKVRRLDSIIFEITGATEEKDYTIYKYNDDYKFIAFEHDKKFYSIYVDNDMMSDVTINGILADKAEKIVDYLYQNYYSKYYSTAMTSRLEKDTSFQEEGGTERQATVHVAFNLTDIQTWTPLNIILYKIGRIGANNTHTDPLNLVVDGLYKEVGGTKRYFKLNMDYSGTSIQAFIKVDDILVPNDIGSDVVPFEASEKMINELLLRVGFIADLGNANEDNRGQLYYASRNEAMTAYTSKTTELQSFYGADNGIIGADDASLITTIAADFNIQDPTKWTWLDILHYYNTDSYRTNASYTTYYIADPIAAKLYIKGEDDQVYYYKVSGHPTSVLTTKFTEETGLETERKITYSEMDYTPLEAIYYRLTGRTTQYDLFGNEIADKIEYIDMFHFKDLATGGTTKDFYYVKSEYDGNYYGVYNLPGSGSGVGLQILQNASGTGNFGDYTDSLLEESNIHKLRKGKIAIEDFTSFTSWSVIDFIVNYTVGSVNGAVYEIYIYKFNSYEFFVIDDMFINITALSQYISYSINASAHEEPSLNINITAGKPLIAQIGFSSMSAGVDSSERTSKLFFSYGHLFETERNQIQNIDTERFTNTSPETTIIHKEVVKFSNGFDANDFSTWKLSDLMIYYAFVNGFYVEDAAGSSEFTYTYEYSYEQNGQPITEVKTLTYSTTNFQSFINNGVAPAYVYYMMKEDAGGNVKTYKIINLGNRNENTKGVYFNYFAYEVLIGKKLLGPVTLQNEIGSVDLVLNNVANAGVSFYHVVPPTEKIIDFKYQNYYYYDINEENFNKFNLYLQGSGAEQLINLILNDEAQISGVINLKLSEGFSLTDTSTWTILDYILMYEYSRSCMTLNFNDTNATANLFYNMKFSELRNADNIVSLYSIPEENQKVLALNGNYYDLSSCLGQKDPETYNFIQYFTPEIKNGSISSTLLDLLVGILEGYGSNYRSDSFELKLKNDLVAYKSSIPTEHNEPSNRAYYLNKKIIESAVAYIASTDAQNNTTSCAFAEAVVVELNKHSSNNALSESDLKIYLTALFEKYMKVMEQTAEFVMLSGSDYKVNGTNGTVVTYGSISRFNDCSVGKYDIRTMVEEIDFAINNPGNVSRVLTKTIDTISYSIDGQPNKFYFKSLYKNTLGSYQISLTQFSVYEISLCVQKVSWPQKLMNDMQVLYPDLNWNTLIATDGWLDTLGDFTSAYTNGMFETKGNSSNTTAAGLVLSEFFLSVASETSDAYAKYNYHSLFDEKVIKSLMLSIMGEQNYKTLSMQAEIFMDFFNNSFASVLDSIAHDHAIEIVDGEVDNFVMCVYKSYLATLLLSSDLGEYLYTVATRVYAEYTIFEALACASGDYASYYAYTNGLIDENGEIADSFDYASFIDLLIYENKLIGTATPVYTFNVFNAYRYYQLEANRNLAEETIRTNFQNIKKNPSSYRTTCQSLMAKIREFYNNEYKYGRRVSDRDPRFCFMYETYYSIYYEVGGKPDTAPFYLNLYNDFLQDEIPRWDILSTISIEGAESYLPHYEDYKNQLTMSKFSAAIHSLNMFLPRPYTTTDADEDYNDYAIKIGDIALDTINSPYGMLYNSFGRVHKEKLGLLLKYNPIVLVILFADSEAGDRESWEKLQTFTNSLGELTAEIQEIIDVDYDDQGNNRTDSGSVKIYSDETYEKVLASLDNLYMDMSDYVTSQKRLDQITKVSISYTLGQYGQNYVSEGYEFVLNGRSYVFDSYLSSQRLAEYVYGGAYLDKFGIEPVYTSADYEGCISQGKTYDSENQMMKTTLGMWPQLREFASELANYTAKLYYTTNLSDLAGNVNDGILLTDYVFGEVKGSKNSITEENGYVAKTTPEYLILQYLVQDERFEAETIFRLVIGDTAQHIEGLGNDGSYEITRQKIDYANMLNMIKYTEGTYAIEDVDGDSDVDDDDRVISMRAAVIDYLIYVQDGVYTSGYYNPDGNYDPSERIHEVFKNVMTYLLVSEEEAEQIGDAEIPQGSEADQEASKKEVLNLDGLNFKEFRLLLIDKLINYKQNPSESGRENTNRYLSIFYLITSQFNYHTLDFEGPLAMDIEEKSMGTVIGKVSLEKYTGANVNYRDMLIYTPKSTSTYLYTTLEINNTTMDNILKLAGLENRPVEELVGLEYESLYDRNGCYDEALGDLFIVCSYDEERGRYIPVMVRSGGLKDSAFASGTKYKQYYDEYKINIESQFYKSDGFTNGADGTVPGAYPIVAKGIITASGTPTAIRMQNGVVQYYRTNMTAVMEMDDEAVSATTTVTETNTVGYTTYVSSSSHKKTSGNNKMTMFAASSNLKTFIDSDTHVYYMQEVIQYTLPTLDDFGAYNTLEQFPVYYQPGGQTWILLTLGITTTLTIMFKASAAVMKRVLDLIFLGLTAPLMISVRSLDDKEKGTGSTLFKNWTKKVQTALLSSFGYIITFNLFYILTTSVIGMEFVEDTTLANIKRIGGFSFLSDVVLESILRYAFIVASIAMIRGGGELLTQLVTSGNAVNPYTSALSGADVMDSVKGVVKEVKQFGQDAKDVVTGQKLLEARDYAMETGKKFIPGSAIIEDVHNNIKHKREDAKINALTSAAVAANPAAGKQLKEKIDKLHAEHRKTEAANKKKRIQNANKFHKDTFGR